MIVDSSKASKRDEGTGLLSEESIIKNEGVKYCI
jgi:hypothetical protein